MCPFSKLKEKTFDFHLISVDSVVKLISNLNPNNGPGISDISVKIFKDSTVILGPVLTELINVCITYCRVPDEWKCAIVTAIYKNNGPIEIINNYREISVLPHHNYLYT
ncbi:RNA-directed DNA polymerase from transposon BS [Brachionus plicatilis]|uniref:RNA-directed DNA polymerase from transposon BS n=1 Tax=Brachionus plicatilis TaxID=10195 RepID=A0A3M7Q0V0_BRAPC|nr:RNA-directed DNA polymerase from transposon BS [Brachionus plicatilis]